jgi:hypothetical protein
LQRRDAPVGVPGVNATPILIEDDIEHPVQLVFDRPVGAHQGIEPRGVDGQAAEVGAAL